MKHLLVTLLLICVLIPLPAGAQVAALESDECGLLGLACPEEATARTLSGTILLVINALLTIIGVIALAVLIWGGVLYIISLGDDGKIASAKKIILYAIVGLVVVGLSGLIVNFTINLFAA